MKFMRIFTLFFLVATSTILFSACSKEIEYTINFDSNGGSEVQTVTTTESTISSIPRNPFKEGYIFDGWYWDNITWMNPFNEKSLLNDSISQDITVYAKWIVDINIAEFYDVEIDQITIVLSILIDDPINLISGAITVNLIKTDDTVVKSINLDSPEDYIGITFTNLDNALTYTVQVNAVVDNQVRTIGLASYSLNPIDIVHITTPEEFLDMKSNSLVHYILDNDLDFTDVNFTTPFIYPFTGIFDGQGYTISNITIETIIAKSIGIFGFVSSGTIKDLNIENVTMGTEDTPLISYLGFNSNLNVGILAGSVQDSTTSIENVSIKNSEINLISSTSLVTYVGAAIGRSGGNLVGLTVDNVSINVISTVNSQIVIGGAIGNMSDGFLKEAMINTDIHFSMAGDELKDEIITISIGGVIGSQFNDIQDIACISDIDVDLDFGTSADTLSSSYYVRVGGITGVVAFGGITNGFYGGSINFAYEENDNEAVVEKTVMVGGLIGAAAAYSLDKLSQIVRLGDEQIIDIVVPIDDGISLYASQTIGLGSYGYSIGVYGDMSLKINSVQLTNDSSTVYSDLDEYFTSEWIQNVYEKLYGTTL